MLTSEHLGPSMITRFLKNQSGATAIEYGLIVAVLSLAIMAGVATTSNSINNLFNTTAGKIDASYQ